jgi:branched-chain amino acid transport system permease protein
VIFGVMDVLNLAHGSFYMLGAFTAYAVVSATGNFWVCLLVGPLVVGLIGGAMEFVFFRRVYRRGHLAQVLLSFGFTLVFVDLVRSWFGPRTYGIAPPPQLAGAFHLAGASFTRYDVFILAVSILVAVALLTSWRFLKIGAVLRAGVSDKEMVGLLGIDLGLLFTLTFAVGAALAGLGGVVAAPFVAIHPAMDDNVLILALVVVVLGGLGSIEGALVGSLLIGLASSFGTFYLQEFSIAIVFALMAAVLVVRPRGLFGIRQ